MWAAEPRGQAVRIPSAPHLRTAPYVTVSAGDSLEGVILFNHYTHPGPLPPPHKMAAPVEERAAASSAPFCGRKPPGDRRRGERRPAARGLPAAVGDSAVLPRAWQWPAASRGRRAPGPIQGTEFGWLLRRAFPAGSGARGRGPVGALVEVRRSGTSRPGNSLLAGRRGTATGSGRYSKGGRPGARRWDRSTGRCCGAAVGMEA